MNQFLTKKLGVSLRTSGNLLSLFLFLFILSNPQSSFATPSDLNCDATAGALTAIGESTVCQEGSTEISALFHLPPTVPAGYQVIYVLTSGTDLVIEAVNTAPEFTVTEEGIFTIHTLVFDPNTLDLSIVQFGVTTGFDVNSLLVQGGGPICAALDVAGAPFDLVDCNCGADAGTMTPITDNCIASGAALLEAETGTPPVVPPGLSLLYVLTQGSDLVIIDAAATPSFEVNEPGEYRIHALVYDPNSFLLDVVVFGITEGAHVNGLIETPAYGVCGDLDVPGALFQVDNCPCEADAGKLKAANIDCLDGSLDLNATTLASPEVPAGYEVLYVLTSGDDLVIQGVNANPGFTVSEEGDYRIHTLVYDPNTLDLSIVEPGVTTGFDVNGLLIQGGGNICASLDVTGAFFAVAECPCTADAGTLTAASDHCLEAGGTADLIADVDQPATIPAGYELIYVLTQGSDLVIIDAGAQPTFTIDETGSYTIHSLVYDPNTLDLGIVELGVTTGVDVNGLLIQGGGDICASLLVAGAQFDVIDCPCVADAGTLGSMSLCFQDDQALIAAEPNGDALVPFGYETIYVLTSTDDLIIQAVNATPDFEVEAVGSYTIHSLVYDPNTLDLGIVDFGVTTGFDVNSLLIQGGGAICASLDVAGANFSFGDCDFACVADAGTLVAASDNCLDGTAELVAETDSAPFVPNGYEVLYVLTSGAGLVIEDVSADPTFTVEEEGLFTIHTLVYNPNTLDLGIVQFGVTTGVDVNSLLIQGGGDICASLDVAGAPFQVAACPCTADAGTLVAASDNCLDDATGTAELIADTDIAPTVPAGYEVLYVLTSGAGLVIEDVSADPAFTVQEAGLFTIHTLVYNPNTLDLGIVEIGVTTGVDVNGLLIQGGGDICASLLVAGAQFEVEACPSFFARPFPNPAAEELNIRFSENLAGGDVFIQITDQSGAVVKTRNLQGLNEVETISIANLPTGSYTVTVTRVDGEVIAVKSVFKL